MAIFSLSWRVHIFKDEYSSLSELYNSILRGNEIQFRYDKKYYYIVPNFEQNEVVSVCFWEAYTENEIICSTESELYNARIENTILGEVASQIKNV